jgi:hypothetical protein
VVFNSADGQRDDSHVGADSRHVGPEPGLN